MADVPGARLEASGLTVARGDRVVLRDVDLRLAAGDVVAVAGGSGSGKSSLLRALVRLDAPVAGRVLVDGADASTMDARELRRRVGLVAQAPVMLPGDVRSNLAHGLAEPDDAALAVALEATGLPPAFLGRSAGALSGGEAARVAVARALVRDPVALLLDEPTAALDPRSTAAVEALVTGLAGRGLAILLVTHDVAQAARVAHRAVRLEDGRLEPAGAA